MRDRFLALLARETAHARAGRPARLIAKMNTLADAPMILALYEASRAGVEIDLIVRGVCCLRPGLEGLSETIRVTSIVGRFLEHSRLWYFLNDGEEEFYLGSADWMQRNFERRVEAVTPVEDKALHEPLRTLLGTYLQDNRNAWILRTDGCYEQRQHDDDAERAAQQILISTTWGNAPLDP
jgi:polyphosphate kinase